MTKLKKYKKHFIIFIIFFLIFLFYLNTNIKNYNNIYNQTTNLNLRLPYLIKKQECNISFLSKNEIFTNKKIVKTTSIKKYLNKKNIIIKNNTIYINNNKYLYLGDLIKKNKHYAIFKLNDNNLTKFIYLSTNDKLANKLVLLKNTNKFLLFSNNNKTYILKKNYININKYTKDKNETKN